MIKIECTRRTTCTVFRIAWTWQTEKNQIQTRGTEWNYYYVSNGKYFEHLKIIKCVCRLRLWERARYLWSWDEQRIDWLCVVWTLAVLSACCRCLHWELDVWQRSTRLLCELLSHLAVVPCLHSAINQSNLLTSPHWRLFALVSSFSYFFSSYTCARLSWSPSFWVMLNSSFVSYRISHWWLSRQTCKNIVSEMT